MAIAEGVFINVPFDNQYRKLFHALVFAINECGFSARCALDGDDGSEVRMDKRYKLIADCPFGIHDRSRTTLDTANRLPRFNMPLELGVFLGAKRYGNTKQKKKSCLILEREQYRYQKFCSDLSGQDIRAHENDVERAISAARNWLRSSRPKRTMPGSAGFRGAHCRGENMEELPANFVEVITMLLHDRESVLDAEFVGRP